MKSQSIEHCALALAREITERKFCDIEEIKTLISVRFKDALIDFIKEQSANEEKEWMKLLEIQAKNKQGTQAYLETGYKLAAQKHRKAITNRLNNNVKQNHKVSHLRKFVIERFGEESIHQFDELYKNLTSEES
jgi:hypothetical protein